MCARNLADTLRKSGREGLSGMEVAARREYLLIKSALGTASVSQLLSVWERHKGEVIGGRSELQLGDAVSQYLALRKDEGLGAERFQHLKLQLERLTALLGVETPLIDLDATALRKWLAGLREDKGMSETTLMHYLKGAPRRSWPAPARKAGSPSTPPTRCRRPSPRPRKSPCWPWTTPIRLFNHTRSVEWRKSGLFSPPFNPMTCAGEN